MKKYIFKVFQVGILMIAWSLYPTELEAQPRKSYLNFIKKLPEDMPRDTALHVAVKKENISIITIIISDLNNDEVAGILNADGANLLFVAIDQGLKNKNLTFIQTLLTIESIKLLHSKITTGRRTTPLQKLQSADAGIKELAEYAPVLKELESLKKQSPEKK